MTSQLEPNPLLEIQFQIPFDRIRAEHVEPAIEELLRDARAKHEALWKAVQRYAGTAEAQGLTGTRRRFLKKTMDDFRRQGAELDAAGKARMAQIDVELSTLTMRFSEHVLDSTHAF